MQHPPRLFLPPSAHHRQAQPKKAQASGGRASLCLEPGIPRVNLSSPKSIAGPRGSPETFRSLDQLLTPASASHGEGRGAERKTAVVSHHLRPPEALSKVAHGRGRLYTRAFTPAQRGLGPPQRAKARQAECGWIPSLAEGGVSVPRTCRPLTRPCPSVRGGVAALPR